MYLPVLISAIVLRVYLVLRDSVPFAYDMGRDLLWSKDIAFYHIPTLIGPAASIWGIYFPPFWYYFLAPFLIISNGNPLSAVFAVSVAVILSGLLSFVLFRKVLGSFFAFTLMVLILFSSNLINISTFAFHANLLPLLTVLMIYFCFLAVAKNPSFIALALFVTSVMFSADPAPAVVFSFVPVVVFIFFKLYKAANFFKVLLHSIIAYTIPFIPQIIFELRNNAIETRSLIGYFSGTNPSLSGQLPFVPRALNRLEVFLDFFSANFTGSYKPLGLLLLVAATFGVYRSFKLIKNQKVKILLSINLLCVLSAFLIYTVLFTVEVKNWYLYGLSIPTAFLIVFALYSFKKNKLLIFIFLSIYLTVNLLHFFNWEKRFLGLSDPAQLVNQLLATDTIYKDVKDNQFSVYVFTPPIYDLNYQYLIWWQGARLKKGLPSEFAYLPNQPEYVRNKQNYSQNPKTSDLIYLIIENSPENPNYSQKEWLKKFQDYKIVWDKNINNAITVQKRSK